MYGGMDRSLVPELKASDEKLIADTTAHYGSRRKASSAFVNNGFIYYQQDDLEKAMRRFNQAWLIDPENPEAYWGFASVLQDRGKNCDAKGMMEKALTLNPPIFQGFYPDAARVLTLCAITDKSLSAEEKDRLLLRSESLYRDGEKTEPNKPYLYASWATAYYLRGQYADAWAMVKKCRGLGGQLPNEFLSSLRAQMKEPAE